jgi:hypothetical protein
MKRVMYVGTGVALFVCEMRYTMRLKSLIRRVYDVVLWMGFKYHMYVCLYSSALEP